MLTRAVEEETRKQYHEVMTLQNYALGDIKTGRAYVQSYVEYVHYVERIHEAATRMAHGHYPEGREEHH